MPIVEKYYCPECQDKKIKEKFYWNKRGMRVYVECKTCILEILRKRRQERKEEKQFYF